MERTNYVARAKNLIKGTARTTALVIVPLAAAVNAHAGSIALPTAHFNCSTDVDSVSGSCSGGDAQLADLGSGVQGVEFFNHPGTDFALSSGSGTLSLTMTAHDTLSGVIPGGTSIPLRAVFDISGPGYIFGSWSLTFSLGTSSGDSTYGSTVMSCISTVVLVTDVEHCQGHFDLSDQLVVAQDIPAAPSDIWETVRFHMDYATLADGVLTISVPSSSSWDFGSVAATTSAVPEPASLGLMASGLALIGSWIRRRKR